MKNNRPIFWHQGLFLQPQHFQLADLQKQSCLAPLFGFTNPYFWGVSRLKIDEKALEEKYFVIEDAEVLFPDGSHLEFPGNAIIQSRSLEGSEVETRRSLKVYLGLRKWDQMGENVTVTPNLDNVSGVSTRFATTADPEEVPDLYHEGPPGRVKRLSYVPKIFWETEKDQLANYQLLPIAELIQEEDEIKLNPAFIPPSLRLDSSPGMLAIVKEIQEKVVARSLRLEEYKSPRGMQSSDIEPGVFFLLMGLRTISRYAPWLNHIVELPHLHPLAFHEMMIQLYGELTLFSSEFSATGQTADGTRAIPAYDHQDLFRGMNELAELISRLLDEITFGPESVIRLNPDGTYFTGQTSPRVFSDRNVYYLSLRTAKDHQEVKEAMRRVGKLSAKENLPILISRALPGLGLEYVPLPPPGLPQLGNAVYFRVDVSGNQWDDVQRLGNVALHWDDAPEDLAAEIIVLRRS